MTLKIPTLLVVDGFYDDPIAVLQLAQSLPYIKATRTNYPGERTEDLSKVAPEFFAQWRQKFLDYLGACNVNGDDTWEFSTQFQRIPSSVINSELNEGWIHADFGQHVGGVVYLNQEPGPNSGTDLMRVKSGTKPQINSGLQFRNAYYGGRNNISDDEYIRAKAIQAAKFVPDLVAENQFNRAVFFDCCQPHKQSGFGLPGEYRLTQVFFAIMKTEGK